MRLMPTQPDPRLTPADRSPVLDKAKAQLSREHWQPMSYLRGIGFDYATFQELCMRGEAEERVWAPGQMNTVDGSIATGFQASFRLK